MSDTITRGIYVLAREGRLKVGYSARLPSRLQEHSKSLKNYELLGFIPCEREIDSAVRSRLTGLIPKKKDWFSDTPTNRQILVKQGLAQYTPISRYSGMKVVRVPEPLVQELKVRAYAARTTVQALAATILREYIAQTEVSA